MDPNVCLEFPNLMKLITVYCQNNSSSLSSLSCKMKGLYLFFTVWELQTLKLGAV